MSLLNVDYIILTKVLSNRFEKVLPKIINPDEKGKFFGHSSFCAVSGKLSIPLSGIT